jgi:hypothetical protein
MARTHKDTNRKYRYPEQELSFGTDNIAYLETYYSMDGKTETTCIRYHKFLVAGAKTKKRRRSNTSWHWYAQTPGSWVKEFMNQPQRNRGNQWCRKLMGVNQCVLADQLEPTVSRKPHIYYW